MSMNVKCATKWLLVPNIRHGNMNQQKRHTPFSRIECAKSNEIV